MDLVPDERERLYSRSNWHYHCRNFSSHTEGGSCEWKIFHNLVAMRKLPTPPSRTEHQSPSLHVCHFTYWVVVVHISKYREFWDGTHFHELPAYCISFSLINHVFYTSCFVNYIFNPLLEWNSIHVLAWCIQVRIFYWLYYYRCHHHVNNDADNNNPHSLFHTSLAGSHNSSLHWQGTYCSGKNFQFPINCYCFRKYTTGRRVSGFKLSCNLHNLTQFVWDYIPCG